MQKKITLPDGETAQVPTVVGPEWSVHRKTGHLSPELLAPYVKQPRLYMDPIKLVELKASVASQGVRESIVITPTSKAPWADFHPGDEGLPFLIVSGHRRREAALAGTVAAVPVEVRIYKDEAAFNEDAEILNDHRQDLSEVEDGYRYRRKLEAGERITHMVERTGHAYQWILGRVYLTFLCPKIQELIAPELKPRERLAIGFASALGSLKIKEGFDLAAKLKELGDTETLPPDLPEKEMLFRLQHAYLRYCKKQGWKGVVSETFVRTGKRPSSTSTGRPGNGANLRAPQEAPAKPQGLRMQLIDWIRYLNETGFLDMSENDIQKALLNAVAQDLEAIAGRIEMVATTLRQVAGKKTRYSDVVLGDQKRPEQKVLEDC